MDPSMTLPEFDSLWDFTDPAGSEKRFLAIFNAARPNSDAGYLAELLTQVGRAQGLQGRFDEAHHTLDRVQEMLAVKMDRVRIRLLLERGRVFNSSGDPVRARSYFLQAWELAQMETEKAYAVDAAHMLGIVERPEMQIEWNERALAMARTSQQPQVEKWTGPLLNNLGWSFHDLGEYEKALALFEDAVVWREARRELRETRIARWSVARALRSLGRSPQAVELLNRLENELQQSGDADGYVNEELAENLLVLGENEKARHYFALAYEHLKLDEWLVNHEGERLERLKRLSSTTGSGSGF